MKIAAITMVYNEPDFLPLWVRYYSSQFGEANCYVIDHGTDDGSVEGYKTIPILRLPRSPLDDTKRAAQICSIVTALLQTYDAVIHTDVDEIVFADPRLHSSLTAFCAANRLNAVTSHGFEIFHLHDLEPAFDPALPILRQRSWVNFSAAMCKPVLVRKPVIWAPGFHCTAGPVTFGDLYLFHLRWFDFGIALRRLARSRAQAWADAEAGSWQRVPNDVYERHFTHFNTMPQVMDCDFIPQHDPLRALMDQFLASQLGREDQTYKIDLDLRSSQLWRIPECFREVF